MRFRQFPGQSCRGTISGGVEDDRSTLRWDYCYTHIACPISVSHPEPLLRALPLTHCFQPSKSLSVLLNAHIDAGASSAVGERRRFPWPLS